MEQSNSWELFSEVTRFNVQPMDPDPLPLWVLTFPAMTNLSVKVNGAGKVRFKNLKIIFP